MCGINGIFGSEKIANVSGVIQQMNNALLHRGPDAGGNFIGENVALGHRRLSIIDLQAASNQPFLLDDYVIVFNGEIYNYQTIKKDLSEFEFQTNSDTEVLLNAYRKWGVNCLHRLEGMFAFAIWDKTKHELFIARDRLGIKPIYYYRNNESFIFSSEIRALLATDLIPRKLNKNALIDYLRYQTVHAPETIVQNVFMVMPGHYFIISDNEIKSFEYWSPSENYNKNISNISHEEAKQNVKSLLKDAVEKRMIADVPFGAFLSGGIDSSAVVALMAQCSDKPIKTFCVSFDEEKFSEAKYAKIIADKYSTQHTDIRLTPNDFLNLLPGSLAAMDHPSGDGPNTYVVSKVTRENGITMALSGMGGDELFAGYDVFLRMKNLGSKQWMQYFPRIFRNAASGFLQLTRPSVSSDKISEFLKLHYYFIENVYPISRKVQSEKRIKTLTGLNTLPINSVYHIVNDRIGAGGEGASLGDFSKVSVAEMETYLQNVLLRDTDQMSMAHALEVRVPFLDHHLVEYVLGINDDIKYPHSPKKLLVDAMGEMLPSEIVNRPKMGFTLPWEHWMKNELKSFCEERILSLANRSIFIKNELELLWKQFLNGDKRVTWSRVWYLIVLEDWLNRNNISEE